VQRARDAEEDPNYYYIAELAGWPRQVFRDWVDAALSVGTLAGILADIVQCRALERSALATDFFDR